MKPVGIIGTAALSLLLGATAPGWAQQGKPNEPQDKADKQDAGKGQAKAKKQQDKEEKQKAEPPVAQQRADQQQAQQQANRQANQQQAAQLRAQQQANRQANQQQADQQRQPVRLSLDRQQQLINAQQQRVNVYRQDLDEQQLRTRQSGARLRQQNRVESYRYYQTYVTRMGQQQVALHRSYDYDNDPYFYTAANYRYLRSGRYYETNEYGVNVLRQAVNNGYAEGYATGQADRLDRWASDYRNAYAYRDANYGYDGYYVNQTEYSYYFREGFHRGYQDGYSSRTQYGRYSNGSRSILGATLTEILDPQSMR